MARVDRDVERKRTDWQWKAATATARTLATQDDDVWIEDLNLRGMQAVGERKGSDLVLGEFVLKLDDQLSSIKFNWAQTASILASAIDTFRPSRPTVRVRMSITT